MFIKLNMLLNTIVGTDLIRIVDCQDEEFDEPVIFEGKAYTIKKTFVEKYGDYYIEHIIPRIKIDKSKSFMLEYKVFLDIFIAKD